MPRPLLGVLLALLTVLGPGCARSRCQGPLTACKSNLKNLGTALEMYSTDWSGSYPPSLQHLTDSRSGFPAYLKVIPTCPTAEADTYSQTYVRGTHPDRYAVYCGGDWHHRQVSEWPANWPGYDAWNGLQDWHPSYGGRRGHGDVASCRRHVVDLGHRVEISRATHGGAFPKKLDDLTALVVTNLPGGGWGVCCNGANHLDERVAPFQPQWTPGRGVSQTPLRDFSIPREAPPWMWQVLVASGALVLALLGLRRRRW